MDNFKNAHAFDGQAGTADATEEFDISPITTCRISAIPDADWVDAGGIDQTVILTCSVDGTNYDTTAATLTFTAASANKISSAVDVRGYSRAKLSYTANGCTAGTFDAWLHGEMGA